MVTHPRTPEFKDKVSIWSPVSEYMFFSLPVPAESFPGPWLYQLWEEGSSVLIPMLQCRHVKAKGSLQLPCPGSSRWRGAISQGCRRQTPSLLSSRWPCSEPMLASTCCLEPPSDPWCSRTFCCQVRGRPAQPGLHGGHAQCGTHLGTGEVHGGMQGRRRQITNGPVLSVLNWVLQGNIRCKELKFPSIAVQAQSGLSLE